MRQRASRTITAPKALAKRHKQHKASGRISIHLVHDASSLQIKTEIASEPPELNTSLQLVKAWDLQVDEGSEEGRSDFVVSVGYRVQQFVQSSHGDLILVCSHGCAHSSAPRGDGNFKDSRIARVRIGWGNDTPEK